MGRAIGKPCFPVHDQYRRPNAPPSTVATEDTKLQLRQYAIRFKKSGTRIPRVALQEMGPRVGLAVRRYRLPPADMAKEALKQAKIGKKKVRCGGAGGAGRDG